MISRRQMITGLVGLAALALRSDPLAAALPASKIEWPEFVAGMKDLSQRFAAHKLEQQQMEREGLALISRLDVNAASFARAQAQSFESGNAFWLWQRMIRSGRLDGGILNIDRSQMIPLHDHPGATGMVRVISGEAEAWTMTRIDKEPHAPGKASLKLVSRRILRPGDMAMVTPENGNIHALRSVSKECRMLDFFIPPFDRRSLLFFRPVNDNWFDEKQISCRAIPRTLFTHA